MDANTVGLVIVTIALFAGGGVLKFLFDSIRECKRECESQNRQIGVLEEAVRNTKTERMNDAIHNERQFTEIKGHLVRIEKILLAQIGRRESDNHHRGNDNNG